MNNNDRQPPQISPGLSAQKYNAIAMLRVSTDAQDMARQRADMQKIARTQNVIFARNVEFHGVSGTAVLGQADYQKLLDELSDPIIHGIAVSALDRLFRTKRYGQMAILDRFCDTGKLIFSAREGIVDPRTDSGFELCMSLQTRAGAEWRELRRRSMDGKQENALAGFLNSASVPYGYRFVLRDKMSGARAHMVIHEIEAAVVRRVFALALARMGVYQIAKVLNSEGILTKRAGKIDSKKTGRVNSGKWSQTTVYQMLKQRGYMGKMVYKANTPDAVDIPCPPIIDEGVWQAVQMQLEENKSRRGPATSRKYMLTGLGWCAYCGHRLTTSPRPKGRAYYRCGNISYKPPMHRICTDMPYVDKDKLEGTIWRALWGAMSDGATLIPLVAAYYAEAPITEEQTTHIAQLKEKLAQLKRVEERAYEMMRDPDLPRLETKARWQDAQKARCNAEYALNEAESASASKGQKPSDDALKAMATDLAKDEPTKWEDRHAFIRSLITEVRTDGVSVTIEVSIPFDILGPTQDAESERQANEVSYTCIEPYKKLRSPSLLPSLKPPISFQIKAVIA